ncbi:16S rRNA (guanine(966)-N(2))-methyltransferase RsmD [Candidatus Phytoplasma melaleucae]|uniref:16S rRNA (Guanine(966)-N(2))-methyltransferase RsmD n=1 Tax=Candidatus Phytoplasma melaleucae TaxID=2982630 RepID=A0ABT9DEW6_9MOLU|nr:16S rRNA (guanine(966)-N(2))-methyltransferase RsmD ['Melaleuca sp.' phytoplasma]MDO8168247.1 16S rRNA (guanine(966)-N(2))-methyltransferase RsmD ['Melaleuca sp.' phytoplasma]
MLRIISGKYKKFKLNLVPSCKTKSSTHLIRKALFDTVGYIIENSVVLDLFSGSGAYGFEALSRNAKIIYMVDNSFSAYKTIRKNQQKLNLSRHQTRVFYSDAFKILKMFIAKKLVFDLIIVDPPYFYDLNILYKHLFVNFDKITNDNSWIIYETDHKKLMPSIMDKFYLTKNKKYGRKKLMFYKKNIFSNEKV